MCIGGAAPGTGADVRRGSAPPPGARLLREPGELAQELPEGPRRLSESIGELEVPAQLRLVRARRVPPAEQMAQGALATALAGEGRRIRRPPVCSPSPSTIAAIRYEAP